MISDLTHFEKMMLHSSDKNYNLTIQYDTRCMIQFYSLTNTISILYITSFLIQFYRCWHNKFICLCKITLLSSNAQFQSTCCFVVQSL